MINSSKIISIVYAIIFLALVFFIERDEIINVAMILLGPLSLIWFGEWFMDNFGGTVVGMFTAEHASFLEGKTVPVFGWFVLIFYSIIWFFVPNFAEYI